MEEEGSAMKEYREGQPQKVGNGKPAIGTINRNNLGMSSRYIDDDKKKKIVTHPYRKGGVEPDHKALPPPD